jgi:hypothetical protein
MVLKRFQYGFEGVDVLITTELIPRKGDRVTAAAELVVEIGQVQQFVGADEDMDGVTPIRQRLDSIHLILKTTWASNFL